MSFVSNACASFQSKEIGHLEQQPNIKLCLGMKRRNASHVLDGVWCLSDTTISRMVMNC
jgi:hypothetical protein